VRLDSPLAVGPAFYQFRDQRRISDVWQEIVEEAQPSR
jgi:hypothetical protein